MTNWMLYRYRRKPLRRDIGGDWTFDYVHLRWVNYNLKHGVHEISERVMEELPYEVNSFDLDIPIFNMLKDLGANIEDFYEYRGEPVGRPAGMPPDSRSKEMGMLVMDLVKKDRDD